MVGKDVTRADEEEQERWMESVLYAGAPEGWSIVTLSYIVSAA
jgi:hypothetical protein